MTFRTTINSNHRPKDFLRRGLKSMFPNYAPADQTAPPVDTEGGKEHAEKK